MNLEEMREALVISVAPQNAYQPRQMAAPMDVNAIMEDYEPPLGELLALLNACKIKGLRFAPTERELMEYLRVFVTSRAAGREGVDKRCIPEVNFNKVEPGEIPRLCQTAFPGEKTEYYFFHHSGKKYPTSGRQDRSTKGGFWKATGKPTNVMNKHNVQIGERRTLVFYKAKQSNKVPQNDGKTDWIMHEFRPAGAGISSDDGEGTWVVCSVSSKPHPPPASPTESQHGPQPPPASPTESQQGLLSPEPASPLSSSTSAVSGIGNNPSPETGRASLKNKSPPRHYDDSGLPSPLSASSTGGDDHFLDQEDFGINRAKAPRIETANENRPNLSRSSAFIRRQDAASDASLQLQRQQMVQQWPGHSLGDDMEKNAPVELPFASYALGVEVSEPHVAGGVSLNPSSVYPPGTALFNCLTFNNWDMGGMGRMEPATHVDSFDGEGTGEFVLWDFPLQGPPNGGN